MSAAVPSGRRNRAVDDPDLDGCGWWPVVPISLGENCGRCLIEREFANYAAVIPEFERFGEI
jgi:hypothetical protein